MEPRAPVLVRTCISESRRGRAVCPPSPLAQREHLPVCQCPLAGEKCSGIFLRAQFCLPALLQVCSQQLQVKSVEFPTTFSPIPEPTAGHSPIPEPTSACDLWGCLWCVGGQSPRVCLCPSWWLLLPTALCLSYCSHRAACCPAFGGDICVCHALLALLPTGSAFHSFLVTHPSFLQCSPEWNMARRAQLCFWLLRLRLFGSRSCVISIASIPPLEMQAHFHQPSEMVTFCSP